MSSSAPWLDADPDAFDDALMESLVEGFRARAGSKERFQALSEYEVARRMGVVDCSYVEYDDHPERERVRSALSRLQHKGRVQVSSMAGRYETFVPAQEPTPWPTPSELPSTPPASRPSQSHSEAVPASFEGKLDEMIRLLRSIDARLDRIERG